MSNKINEMIDKAIGKDGPLRIGAYWLNKILKDILAKTKSDVSSIEAKTAENAAKIEAKTAEIEENKADKMNVKSLQHSGHTVISPNIYYKLTPINNSLTLKFKDDTATHYKEYIIEITCTQYAPKLSFKTWGVEVEYPISWANGLAPELEVGNTYLISISNGLGIFSTFPNQ